MNPFRGIREIFTGLTTRGSHVLELQKELGLQREAYNLSQRAQEDANWVKVGEQSMGSHLPPLPEMARLSKLYKDVSPQGGAIVRLKTTMCFEQGISKPRSKDPRVQTVIDDIWYDRSNIDTFSGFGAQAMLSDQLEVEANLVIVIWTTPDFRKFRIRIRDVADVTGIIKDPEDNMMRLYYQVTQRKVAATWNPFGSQTAWPMSDAMFLPSAIYDEWARENADSPLVGRASAEDCFVHHVRQNCLINEDFGIPESMKTVDWIQAHKQAAGNFATLVRNIASWDYQLKFKKSANAVIDAAKTKLNMDTTNMNNPPPAVGSTFMGNENVSLEPINTPTGGAQIMASLLRELLIQVSAGSGFPEHYFGSARGGSYGLATGMELPVLKAIRFRQAFIGEEVYKRPIIACLDRHPATRAMTSAEKALIDVDFPLPYERDLVALSTSLATGLQEKIITPKLAAQQFLGALGVNNLEEEVEDMLQAIADEAEKVRKERELTGADPPFGGGENQPMMPGQPAPESKGKGGSNSPEQKNALAVNEARVGFISKTLSDINRLMTIQKIAVGGGK